MRRTIKAYVSPGENHWVAECMEIGVVTQGKTLDETIANLKKATALFLEGEDPSDYDLAPNPSLMITIGQRNKNLAVPISMDDEELLEYLEDQEDIREARKALREGGPSIDWEDAKKELGLK